MSLLSNVTLTCDLQTRPSKGPNTSCVWIWRRSVQRFRRYFVHKHWRRQLWGTGARAPLTSNNLFFFSWLQSCTKSDSDSVWLPLQNVVFCDSSCGSSVAATWTLFSVYLASFYVRQKFHVVLCSPSHQILATPLYTNPQKHILTAVHCMW